jgi:hypothetical protein
MSSRPEPPPQNGSGDPLWPAVIARYADRPAFAAAARERHEFGVAKYGCALRAHNCRNARIDALQEAMDLIVYLEQMAQEAPSGWDARAIRNQQLRAVDLAQWLLDWGDQ